jgi:GPH family glycoside/pentoside/hexuronide:cation symporter
MKLRPKWGMRKVILSFGILRVIGTIILFLIAVAPGLELLLWIGFAWTTFFAGYGVFTTGALMPLSMDEDEVKHGTRREGMFLGINALFTKPANSIGPVIATLLFVAFGFVQGAETQTNEALLGVKILFLLIPAIFTAISLIFIYFYPLHGEKLDEMRKKLEILHKEKIEAAK